MKTSEFCGIGLGFVFLLPLFFLVDVTVAAGITGGTTLGGLPPALASVQLTPLLFQ